MPFSTNQEQELSCFSRLARVALCVYFVNWLVNCIWWMCCNKLQVILMISFYAIIPQNPCKQFLPFLVSPRLSCTEVLPLCTSLSCRKELLNCLELRPPKTNTTKKVSVVFYAPRTEKRLKRDKKLEKKELDRKNLKSQVNWLTLTLPFNEVLRLDFDTFKVAKKRPLKLWSQLTFYHAH